MLIVLVVGWAVSPTLALAAGLAVSLLLTMALLAGGWWLIQLLEETRMPLTPEPRTQNPEPRLLLVEDDPIGQRVVTRLLQQLGVQTDIVGDGQAAVDAVAANEYALVLMDCEMPVLDGYAATAEIRRLETAESGMTIGEAGETADGASVRHVPIVAMTSSMLDADRQRALAAGMDEHLTKPLDVARLAELLTRWGVRHQAAPGTQPEQPAERTSEHPVDRLPILDPAGLPTVNGRLSAPYREIVQLFQQEAARRRAALDVAVAVPDRVQVARIAHTLAGSSSSIGALRLAAACSVLEVLAKGSALPSSSPSGRADDAPPDMDRALAEAVEEVRCELRLVEAALARL